LVIREILAAVSRVQNEHFHSPPAGFTTGERCWNNTGLIDHQKVGRQQQAGKFLEKAMMDLTCVPMEHHQARLISCGTGRLSNKALRESVVIGGETIARGDVALVGLAVGVLFPLGRSSHK